jgi:hypothetical protein
MIVIGLGALLVFGGVLYMVRAVIYRGSLSGSGSSSSGPVRGTLEPPRRGLGFLGLGPNWPGFLLIAIGAISVVVGDRLLAPFSRRRTSTSRNRDLQRPRDPPTEWSRQFEALGLKPE